jgi:putative ABC transport system substrate-binding protein
MMKKKLAAILMIALSTVTVFSMTACNKEKYDYVIGINQLVEHPALSAASEGFIKNLDERLAEVGKKARYDWQKGDGGSTLASTIANTLVAKNVNLIYAVATDAAVPSQTAARSAGIPVMFAAVTDPVTAGLTENHVTGTSDYPQIEPQVALLAELLGNANSLSGKKIGTIYTTGESNAATQNALLTAAVEALGGTVQLFGIPDATGLAAAFGQINLAGIDALYLSTDNTVAANMEQIGNLNKTQTKLPIICADTSMAKTGGVIASGVDYYNMGVAGGKIAFDILVNGISPKDIPTWTQPLEELELYVNTEYAASINFTIPDSILAKVA